MSSMFDEETETATNEGQEHQAQSGGPGVVIDLDSINVPYDTAAIKKGTPEQCKSAISVMITGEVTVSALYSPHLWMLRDCKCLVRCQVSGCPSQFPSSRKRCHTRVCRNSGSTRQIKQAAR